MWKTVKILSEAGILAKIRNRYLRVQTVTIVIQYVVLLNAGSWGEPRYLRANVL